MSTSRRLRVENESGPDSDFHALLSAAASVIHLWETDKLDIRGNPSLHHLAAVLAEIADKRKSSIPPVIEQQKQGGER